VFSFKSYLADQGRPLTLELTEPATPIPITVLSPPHKQSILHNILGPVLGHEEATKEQEAQKAEDKARKEALEKVVAEAEEQVRREAVEQARKEAEDRHTGEAKEEAKEVSLRRHAEAQAKEAAEREAEEQARREAVEQARKEEEERARKAEEEQARKEVEEQARKEMEEQAREQAAKELAASSLRNEASRRRRSILGSSSNKQAAVGKWAQLQTKKAGEQQRVRLAAEGPTNAEATTAEGRKAEGRSHPRTLQRPSVLAHFNPTIEQGGAPSGVTEAPHLRNEVSRRRRSILSQLHTNANGRGVPKALLRVAEVRPLDNQQHQPRSNGTLTSENLAKLAIDGTKKKLDASSSSTSTTSISTSSSEVGSAHSSKSEV
jgi:hypothetical protein